MCERKQIYQHLLITETLNLSVHVFLSPRNFNLLYEHMLACKNDQRDQCGWMRCEWLREVQDLFEQRHIVWTGANSRTCPISLSPSSHVNTEAGGWRMPSIEKEPTGWSIKSRQAHVSSTHTGEHTATTGFSLSTHLHISFVTELSAVCFVPCRSWRWRPCRWSPWLCCLFSQPALRFWNSADAPNLQFRRTLTPQG